MKLEGKAEASLYNMEGKLKGVNRHDTHPTNGYTMTEEELVEADLETHGPKLLEKYRLAEKEIEFGFWMQV